MRRLSFLHTDHRAREGAVVCDHLSSPSTDLAPFSANMKVDSSWRGGIQRCPGGVSSLSGPRQPGKDPQHSGRDASLKESASCPCRTWGLLAHLMSCPLKKHLPASVFCEGFCNDRVPRGDRIESTSHAMLFRVPKPHEQGAKAPVFQDNLHHTTQPVDYSSGVETRHLSVSKARTPQPERVSDHRDRAQAHRGGGEHR